MSDPFIGQINMFAGNFAPRSYTLCQGQLLPISQNTALFAILGTIYGGDGRTTFAVPNLESRAPMHWGSGPGLTPRQIGQTGGSDSVTLTEGENPLHNHPMLAGTVATSNQPAADRAIANATLFAAPSDPALLLDGNAIAINGSGSPHENRQAFLPINFIIALVGVFPSRN